MKFNKILASLLCLLPAAGPAFAQAPSDSIFDNNIVYPSALDTDIRNLQDNWYLQRYAVLDSVARMSTGESPSDEVYIDRLQRLPNVIEMPFNSIVKNHIEFYANRKQPLVEKMLGMSLYYMPIFEEALERYQLPLELKYLPIIESALDPNAVSKAGACGLWQFMSQTAIGEGLEVNSLIDERRDPLASSDAAARYLKKLYDMFGDWTLAIAAYNCGPGNVSKAIKQANDKNDYWQIYFFLPKETRGYVPAFIAANYIMNYYGEHGISHALARKPIVTDTVHISKRVHFKQISDVLGLPIDEIRALNPQYRADIVPGNIRPYTLILPSMQALCYAANEDSIINYMADTFCTRTTVEPTDPNAPELAASAIKSDENGTYQEVVEVTYHKVKKGETIKSIANKYGVSVESIRKANNISGSRVKTGKTLKINTVTKKYIASNDSIKSDSATVAPAKPAPAQEVAQTKPAKQETKPAQTKPAKQETKPEQTKKTEPKKAQTQKPATPKTQKYTVKKGDTLSKIASKYGVTIDQIKKQNGLKNDKIQIGQTLVIPAKK